MLQLNQLPKTIKLKTKKKISPVRVWKDIVRQLPKNARDNIGGLDVDVTEKIDNCLYSLVEIYSHNVNIEICSYEDEDSINVEYFE